MSRKSRAERARNLRDEALEHVRKGSPATALVRLAELERLMPTEPEYPQRSADCHRSLGNTSEQLAALGRAAELHANDGAFAKAIALCKVILGVDPNHTATQARLAELVRTVSPVPIKAPPPARARPPTPAAAARVVEPLPAAEPEKSPAAPGKPTRARPRLEQLLRQRRAEQARAAGDAPRAEPAVPSAVVAEPTPAETPLAPAPPAEGSGVHAAPPATALPFLPAGPLSEHVPGSRPIPGPRGVPSGMYRIDVDDIPVLEPADPKEVSVRALPATPLFSELGPAALSSLIAQARLVHLNAGDIVYRQNDVADALYVIVSGVVAIVTEGDSPVETARLGDNDFFGETALISNELRLSTARALEPTDVLAIDRSVIAELVEQEPRLLKTVLRFLRERLVESLVLTNPLFTILSRSERRVLAARFEFIEFDRGSLLVRQRTRSPGLFVLLCGTVEVTRREPRHVRFLALLHAGGVFGEMSLVGSDPAVADVRSVSRGFALMLPEPEFRRVIDEHPSVLEFVRLLAEARRIENQKTNVVSPESSSQAPSCGLPPVRMTSSGAGSR